MNDPMKTKPVPALLRILHTSAPAQGEISGAEEITLRLHRRIRQAECDPYALHRLLEWNRLQTFVDKVLAGRAITAMDTDKSIAWQVAAWLAKDTGEELTTSPGRSQ